MKKNVQISDVAAKQPIPEGLENLPVFNQERMDFSKDTFGFSSVQQGRKNPSMSSVVGESIVFGKEKDQGSIRESFDNFKAGDSHKNQEMKESKPDMFNLTFQNMDFSNFQSTNQVSSSSWDREMHLRKSDSEAVSHRIVENENKKAKEGQEGKKLDSKESFKRRIEQP